MTNDSIKTIKVTGCDDCPFKDYEYNTCSVLDSRDAESPAEVGYGGGIRLDDVDGFHKKCPLHKFKIEVIKDSN